MVGTTKKRMGRRKVSKIRRIGYLIKGKVKWQLKGIRWSTYIVYMLVEMRDTLVLNVLHILAFGEAVKATSRLG